MTKTKQKIKRSTIFAALLKHKNAKQWDTSAKTHCTWILKVCCTHMIIHKYLKSVDRCWCIPLSLYIYTVVGSLNFTRGRHNFRLQCWNVSITNLFWLHSPLIVRLMWIYSQNIYNMKWCLNQMTMMKKIPPQKKNQ